MSADSRPPHELSSDVAAIILQYDSVHVATVERCSEPGPLRLTYQQDWLARDGAFPVSVRFPLTQLKHEGQDVYLWFVNLLPEGDALNTIAQILDVSILDVMAIVARLGGDLPGALTASFGTDTAERKPSFYLWTEATLATDIRRLPQRPLLIGHKGVQTLLAGQQAKLPVAKLSNGRLALPLNGHPSTHILKPTSRTLHCSVENEAYCLRLAARCDLSVAEAEVGRVENIEYLLVRRYDREGDAGHIRRLHQEDLCQALGFLPFQKYEWNPSLRLRGPSAQQLIDAFTPGDHEAPSRLAMFDALVFNILICNVDSHAKNFACLHLGGQPPTMAPMYDLLCGRIYDWITENLPQKISGMQRGDGIERAHWEQLAKENGFAPAPSIRRIASLAEKVLAAARPLAEEHIDETPNSKILPQIAAVIEARCRRVLSNLAVTA